jgi:hypothetical protein
MLLVHILVLRCAINVTARNENVFSRNIVRMFRSCHCDQEGRPRVNVYAATLLEIDGCLEPLQYHEVQICIAAMHPLFNSIQSFIAD